MFTKDYSLPEIQLQEFKNYKNSLEHLKKVVSELLVRCEKEGLNQNFSCNSEVLELGERVKFTSYKLYTLQNYLKDE